MDPHQVNGGECADIWRRIGLERDKERGDGFIRCRPEEVEGMHGAVPGIAVLATKNILAKVWHSRLGGRPHEFKNFGRLVTRTVSGCFQRGRCV